jgi:hypothetical protein
MIRRLASACMLVALAPLTVAACDKDKKDGEDAAAEAAVAVVVDAAPEAGAPVVSASAAPLPPPVVVKTAPKPPPAPDPPICAAARNARARGSPAAVNLEKQCIAAGGKP